jgi:DNA-binding NtrC family response regulator
MHGCAYDTGGHGKETNGRGRHVNQWAESRGDTEEAVHSQMNGPDRGRKRAGSAGRCLLVEDDDALRRFVTLCLADKGWDVTGVPRVKQAREALAEQSFDLLITDVYVPDGTGFDLLQAAKRKAKAPATIVITGDSSVDHAVQALREGASDFLLKPFSMNALHAALDRLQLVKRLSIAPRNGWAKSAMDDWRACFVPNILGSDPALLAVFGIIERVADTDCSVLITGESGTGKELVARAIHDASNRRGEPFVAVNCAAIPESLLESELFGYTRGAFTGAATARVGRFAAADGGTIFLDEIGEMPLGLQAKILRLLQEKEVTPLGESKPRKIDVRVVAATNRNLEEMVRAKTFREDLMYRLTVIPVELPALRDRKGDIPELVRHFVERANQRRGRAITGVSPRAMEILQAHDWPGNVRELENMVERIVLLKGEGEIQPEDLPPKLRAAQSRPAPSFLLWGEPPLPPEGIDLREAVEAFETSLIRQALERVGGNKNRAAALLQMNRTTLVEKLKKKQIVVGDDG